MIIKTENPDEVPLLAGKESVYLLYVEVASNATDVVLLIEKNFFPHTWATRIECVERYYGCFDSY